MSKRYVYKTWLIFSSLPSCAHSDHHRLLQSSSDVDARRARLRSPNCLRSHWTYWHDHIQRNRITHTLATKWITQKTANTLCREEEKKPVSTNWELCWASVARRPSLYLIILLPLPVYKMYYVSLYFSWLGVVCLRLLALSARAFTTQLIHTNCWQCIFLAFGLVCREPWMLAQSKCVLRCAVFYTHTHSLTL